MHLSQHACRGSYIFAADRDTASVGYRRRASNWAEHMLF